MQLIKSELDDFFYILGQKHCPNINARFVLVPKEYEEQAALYRATDIIMPDLSGNPPSAGAAKVSINYCSFDPTLLCTIMYSRAVLVMLLLLLLLMLMMTMIMTVMMIMMMMTMMATTVVVAVVLLLLLLLLMMLRC